MADFGQRFKRKSAMAVFGGAARMTAPVARESIPGLLERLRQCVELAGSANKLAQKSAIPRRTLDAYLSGSTEPKLTALVAIAKAAGASFAWLAAGEGRSAQAPSGSALEGSDKGPAFSIVGEPQLEREGFVLLPRYDVMASAGGGSLVHSEQIVDFLAVKLDWLRRTLGVAPENLALISAVGDSMKPTIKEGDLLMLDRSADHVRDNAIYAIRINGALLVKRIQVLMSGGLRIISDNPVYPPEDVTARAVDDLSVVGRIIWHGGPV